MYIEGKGVTQNDATAVEWFQKAANQDLATAQYNLGYMYYHGRGVSQDTNIAKELFQKAAEQGNTDAQHYLSLI